MGLLKRAILQVSQVSPVLFVLELDGCFFLVAVPPAIPEQTVILCMELPEKIRFPKVLVLMKDCRIVCRTLKFQKEDRIRISIILTTNGLCLLCKNGVSFPFCYFPSSCILLVQQLFLVFSFISGFLQMIF